MKEEKKHCKWYNDEFCTNGDSPCVADYCPVVEYPELCKCREEDLVNDTEINVGMTELSDEEIIKDLERYIERGYTSTPAEVWLAFIKRLLEENKTLKAELRKECEEHEEFVKKAKEEIDYLKKCGDNFLADYEKAQKEIERLTEENEALHRQNANVISFNDALYQEKAELQKQVDELERQNNRKNRCERKL